MMRLRVLGRTGDEKGAQLEALTARLLRRLGYEGIILNAVGTGGHELDIVAEYCLPGLDKQRRLTVIGECKAHEAMLGTSDWLKFLGKVLLEEASQGEQVQAILISLSGVNGPVASAHRDLSKKRSRITVVTGEHLAELVKEEFGLAALHDVATYARNSSATPAIEISLAYYCEATFWVIEFSDGRFTVVCGARPERVAPADVVDMVGVALPESTFQDLGAEAEAHRRSKLGRKGVLSALLVKTGPLSAHELHQECELLLKEDDLTEAEVRAATDGLQADGLLKVPVDEKWQLQDLSEDVAARVSVLRQLTDEFFLPSVHGTPGYERLIDERLLSEISSIQGGVSIPEEQHAECLSLLSWSPSALYWALRPDPMIAKHREEGQVGPQLDENDLRYLRTQLIRLAVADFQTSGMMQSYYERLGMRELEFKRTATFKGADGVLLNAEVTERSGLMPLSEEYGGGVVRVWLYSEVREPWALQGGGSPPGTGPGSMGSGHSSNGPDNESSSASSDSGGAG